MTVNELVVPAGVGGLDHTSMLILDGQHAGHVANLVDDTWTCSCTAAVPTHA